MERDRLPDRVAQEAVATAVPAVVDRGGGGRRPLTPQPQPQSQPSPDSRRYLMSGTAVSFLKASKTCLDLLASHSTADSPVLVR